VSSDGVPLRAAVLGSPIGHSKSPLLHGTAYRMLGIGCSYAAIDTDAPTLPEVITGVRGTPGWRGLSVTMPLKGAVVPLSDDVTDLVSLLGVANTVVVGPGTGSPTGPPVLSAHNTDVVGVSRALAAAGAGQPERAVILGGGGTAAAAVAGLAALGAGSIRVLVRRPDAADELRRIGAALAVPVQVSAWSEAPEAVRAADVVVSTLPPRAADGLAADVRGLPAFRTRAVLLDVAYDPWPSALAGAWSAAGGTVVAGLEMLLHQAVEQVRLFFPEVEQDPLLVLGAMRGALATTPR
jgi:shikimate dehydrogenase